MSMVMLKNYRVTARRGLNGGVVITCERSYRAIPEKIASRYMSEKQREFFENMNKSRGYIANE